MFGSLPFPMKIKYEAFLQLRIHSTTFDPIIDHTRSITVRNIRIELNFLKQPFFEHLIKSAQWN